MSTIPNWNLKDFYDSINDKKIYKDILEIDNKISVFVKQYNPNLISRITPESLYKAIVSYEKICEMIAKISSYAYLVYASDLSNQKNIAFFQDISEKMNEKNSHLIYFNLEINKFSDDKIKKYLNKSSDLRRYSAFIRDVRLFKKYQLSNDLEKFLVEKNISSKNAWIRFFDETVNNLEFEFRKKKLNSQQIFNYMSDADEKNRRDAAHAISKSLKTNIKTFAYITNILAKDKSIEDNLRGFKNPISSRNLGNFVEDEIVETLVKSVRCNYKNISHRYYKIKAKILNKKYLNYWDRNAPLNKYKESISWNDAKNLVLESYNDFDPKLKNIAKLFFDNNWIDAKVKSGKDSGAFSHPCVPSVHPYILMNYQGKVRDVMTLAHELGHGIHQFLSKKQGYLMSETPLTLSETASVFGEQLTFQKILKLEKNSDKKRIIIANKIEDMINTSIRQIAFLEFEKKIHDQRKHGEISVEKICQNWIEVQKESLGNAFKISDDYKFFWSYIPHFIHSPFYVYSYAFGDCLVNSLYSIYRDKKVKDFEKKYISMLELGGVEHHKEMLKPFNLDASDKDFWQSGLNIISDYIDMIE